MGRIGKEVAGQVISFAGLVLACVCCGVPMWRVTSYIGANIVTGQVVWDGLWMNCVMQSTGQMQCKINDSLMRLSQDLQAARALVIICLIFGFIGFIITFVGAKCTSCLKKDSSNATVVIIGGCLLILAAILILVPVCWSAAVSVSDYLSNLTIETQKREIGASIYIDRQYTPTGARTQRRTVQCTRRRPTSRTPGHTPGATSPPNPTQLQPRTLLSRTSETETLVCTVS
uniref:Claudin n=1 Tax=Xiphophorus maculatus TaxID=8083 RepID=A0A3B5Q2X2_XIPMA